MEVDLRDKRKFWPVSRKTLQVMFPDFLVPLQGVNFKKSYSLHPHSSIFSWVTNSPSTTSLADIISRLMISTSAINVS